MLSLQSDVSALQTIQHLTEPVKFSYKDQRCHSLTRSSNILNVFSQLTAASSSHKSRIHLIGETKPQHLQHIRQQKHPPENIKLKITLYIGKCSKVLLMTFIYNLRLKLVLILTVPCSFIYKIDLLEKGNHKFSRKISRFQRQSCILCSFHIQYGMNNNSISRTADYLLNKPNQHQLQIVFTTARHSSKHASNCIHAGFSQVEIQVDGGKKEPTQHLPLSIQFS